MENESPIFVCECCGKIVRAISYEETDVNCCPFCKTIMTKTSYSMYENEYYLFFGDSDEAVEFRDSVFQEYVRFSPRFDSEKQRQRFFDEFADVRKYMKSFKW